MHVEFLAIETTSKIWVSIKDVGSGIGVKNISDFVLKEIYGICETKNPSKEQVNEYKMTKKQIYKKFTNLSQVKLNTINNEKMMLNWCKMMKKMLMSKIMLWQLLLNVVEERGIERGIRERHKSNWWI